MPDPTGGAPPQGVPPGPVFWGLAFVLSVVFLGQGFETWSASVTYSVPLHCPTLTRLLPVACAPRTSLDKLRPDPFVVRFCSAWLSAAQIRRSYCDVPRDLREFGPLGCPFLG